MPRLSLLALVAIACGPVDTSIDGRPNPLSADEPPPVMPEPTREDPILPDLELEDLGVVINEVMARNDTWVLDNGTRQDWVELANPGDEPADLSHVSLEDGNGNRWTGSGTLAPGARLLLTSDELGFALDASGDTLTLFGYTEVLDEWSWESMGRDVAWARTPDMADDVVPTAWATPGLPNEATASPTADPATEHVFVSDMVHRIDFTLTPEAFDKMNSSSEKWVVAEMSFDGIYYAEIGLRLKGSASFDTMDGKPAFKVDMNKGVPGQRLFGLKGFNLHNGNVLDPTRARDHISYGFARAGGIMAPRVGFAEVYVNGNPYFIYMIIEQHDDVMIEHFFPGMGETGVMLEPNESRDGGWGGDFGNGNATDFDYEEGPIPPDLDVMGALVEADRLIGEAATDANVEALWEVVDQHNLTTYMAWEAIVSHTDGYKAPNNWRVFVHPVDKKVHLVPAGAEWTWDFNPSPLSWGGNMADWCLDNINCKRLYGERALEMVQVVEDIDLQQDFLTVSQMLAPYIAADTRSRHSIGTVNSAKSETYDNIGQYPRDVRGDICDDMPNLSGCTR
jgi:hypothetical protein